MTGGRGKGSVAAMSASKSVLFVCTGNTCRSPMAEALFRKAVEERGDFEVASAGVAAYPGDGANPETLRFLASRGVELNDFESQPVSAELLERATHVFAMTAGHLDALENLFPDFADKFFLVCEFVEIPGRGVAADVPDPIGMGKKAYAEVGKTLDVAIPSLIAFIDQTWQGGSSK
ncbi:MAG: low molecular weight protein arginine phosphatase [Verrucomicrobia bacterium]|nr:MAG: low molecular weight protein arginine phosphatase [Verrucomicrobiota bacterium]TAF27300.1 MAG: low molecular weight protein arginine phosphatase [Verrucomicrobiota bacterium]TAF42409.1 MAG: low molecular weight protein arginine phosphatase [Verrucomicrobiota bacterium]